MKTTTCMHIFCAFYLFTTTTIFTMYHIPNRRMFDYSTHRLVQGMGLYALPITGFMTMIEKHQKGYSLSDSAISFAIPTGIQTASSMLRYNFNKMIDVKSHSHFNWYTKNSYNKSMVILSTLLVKQYIWDVAEDYYHRKQHTQISSYV